MAPDSARSFSPGASETRAAANDGLCRSSTSMSRTIRLSGVGFRKSPFRRRGPLLGSVDAERLADRAEPVRPVGPVADDLGGGHASASPIGLRWLVVSRTFPVISADSHITEAPDTYTQFIDPEWRDKAPK